MAFVRGSFKPDASGGWIAGLLRSIPPFNSQFPSLISRIFPLCWLSHFLLTHFLKREDGNGNNSTRLVSAHLHFLEAYANG